MEFSIRVGKLEDAKNIAKLFNEYRIFYQQKSDIEQAEVFITQRLEHKESVIFIAESIDSSLAGFVQIYPSFSSVAAQKTLILNDLYVSEKARRNGVAMALMMAAKDYAANVEANGLALSTAVDNKSAQKLYESLGYKKNTEFFQYFLAI